ncbi:MAG: hypothetical protein NT154_08790 [Verrucomicrobia bacterium]|nr:hypothetical protein [Verrucomicrobiota bacterium]
MKTRSTLVFLTPALARHNTAAHAVVFTITTVLSPGDTTCYGQDIVANR